MSSVFSNLIADISTLPWVAIIAVSGGLLLTIVIIVGGLLFANRRQQLWHETARIALEKGQPLPQMPDSAPAPATAAERGAQGDLRSGMIMIAVGAGLFVFFKALLGGWLAYVGAIPGFIGVALVLYSVISSMTQGPKPPADHP